MFGVMFGVSVKIPEAWWHLPGSLFAYKDFMYREVSNETKERYH
jgi:hypothetical protein